jgi:hypothetical protein
MRRYAPFGLVLGLLAVAPAAFGQKIYKCSDGKGGTTIQQSPCPETPQEAEARQKEKERRDAEAARKKADDERKKAEAAEKAKERDEAYKKEMEARTQELKKAEEAQKRLMEGTKHEVSDGTLSAEMEKQYPGPWREDAKPEVMAALAKANARCGKLRYRQRVGGGPGEYLVHCSPDGKDWNQQYFVWPQSNTVRGPYKM